MEHWYKVKRCDPPEWVEGNLVVFQKEEQVKRAILIPMESCGFYTEPERVGFQTWYFVNPNTICKWVGMVDRNGEKIWEYDLVEDQFGNRFLVGWNPIQCAYYGILLPQKNGKQVRACIRLGTLRDSRLKRLGSILDFDRVQRRWMVYFIQYCCYPVYGSRYTNSFQREKS